MLKSVFRVLFGKRRARARAIAAFPGLIALLLVGHAFEDAGVVGVAPYILIILMSASYLIRPTLVAWLPLFGAFFWYAGIVAAHPENGPFGEWVFFMLLGAVPAVLLWLARPRGLVVRVGTGTTDAAANEREA